ncbi:hypothetical protein DXG01_001841 [Tephrocybe rancida]|nr:hypothetical protein DXG01_001841 [Tephrocybe rancida]
MASELSLDPVDQLNFLLSNPSPMDESGTADFNQASMWPETDFNTHMKSYGDMDFNDLASLSMDMDYINAIAVEPSVLQYNNFNPHYGFDAHPASYADEFGTSQFPFTFQNDPSSPSDSSSLQSSASGRRLSISSSVSSSGASFSPAPESVPSPTTAKLVPNYPPPPGLGTSSANTSGPVASDLASQLAERVRKSAGVMLALPMTAQLQAFENQQAAENTAPSSPAAAPKLPIPRLPRHPSQSIASSSSVSSAASTPPPTTPSPSSPSALAPSVPAPRPKTSHTTIERRYRTNLNARIQSLRMAVPALRVVDDREGGKKRAPNKVLVSGDPLKAGGEDVVDERGFVDGVKVARKCSKANVLGKAVEYIRVLKKREGRLKAEQSGLKSLIAGLVGGPALLREWEREWKEAFGGEEKDEVEGEVDADGDDDEDDLDEDDDEEGGRKRKRGKVASPQQEGAAQVKQEKKEKKIVLGPDGTVPEKRKRGRPRKVVPLPAPSPPAEVPAEQVQQQGTQQQYLLATFALFSFFNSPLTSSSSTPTHVHTGSVLNSSAVPLAVDTTGGWSLSYYLQIFHLLVSVVVLLSCVSNWFGGFSVFGKSRSSVFEFSALRTKRRTAADWVRLGETYVLSDKIAQPAISLLSRLQVYHNITTFPVSSAADLCTAVLTLHGFGTFLGGLARARARAVWSSISTKGATAYERLVLEEISVDEAATRLSAGPSAYHADNEDGELGKPMRVLAAALVRERVASHLGVLFVGSVRGEDDADVDVEEREKEVKEWRRTIEAAKELGGHVGELGRRLERLWKVPSELITVDVKGYESEGEEDEVEALAAALVLYCRVFSSIESGESALMSPPPSPGREGKYKDTSDVARLRRALGSRVFEKSEALEDARDRAVDIVVKLERRKVGLD